MLQHIGRDITFREYVYPCPVPTGSGLGEPDLLPVHIGTMESTRGFLCDQITTAVAIHAVWEGSGTMAVEGKPYTVNGGDLFVFFPGLHIRHFDTPLTPWHYNWISMRGNRLPWALAQCGVTPETPHLPGRLDTSLGAHVQALKTAYASRQCLPTFPLSWSWQFISLLQSGHRTEHPSPNLRWIADSSRSLVDAEPDRFSTVDELARQLQVDRTTLFRHFKKAFGISPKQYLEARKMEKAEKLLKETTMLVKEVATACGYNDVNYFCRLFRQKYKNSPEKWRKK